MLPEKLPTQFPVLRTQRLVLREITLEDSQAIFLNYSDEENTRYIMQPLSQPKQADVIIRAFNRAYQNDQAIFWGLTLKDDDTLIGSCSLDQISLEDRHAEVAYDLDKAHWGNGYMTEAMQAVLSYGFG